MFASHIMNSAGKPLGVEDSLYDPRPPACHAGGRGCEPRRPANLKCSPAATWRLSRELVRYARESIDERVVLLWIEDFEQRRGWIAPECPCPSCPSRRG